MAKHELPPLPYGFNALEPSIDAMTMEIHHDRHHGTYVTNLNAALDKYPELYNHSAIDLIQMLDKVPEDIRTIVRNNGGGHVNHTMFWLNMAPKAGGEPTGAVAAAITAAFGGFAQFKEAFAKAGVGRFGSGWAWLLAEKDGKVSITSTPNQDNPLMEGKHPILGLDVWEHAYYLKYQNKRPAYIEAWWNVVNWSDVSQRYAKITGK
jgi:Fe-Mn family superoxide dismutase